ncbi:ABC transporter substrate-binding protein [Gloeocapsopsis dulcis]|uniref:ABC transporter substrate-binding protein n=1 Tax=Gloeocapsopsis dulcis AAB1 = 1H9 TaxID=1433147 RepID=A0A6N8FN66_9CHRO|nr:iron-siderophore ABC transporter substrate-binding protein [Gloeocapsopsis dulcis]MUL34900.1 ABC transporter substrate-binding protein [Gloeocapsopsis dulcis AAB1 = 1H9]WNN90029.1 iron-siderophore ABC transporter substrate-binding protein [Gloeocapsopsis dulcis]
MNIIRWLRFILLIIMSFSIVSACGSRSAQIVPSLDAASNCRIIQHALGETCVPAQPQRVIVLGVPTLGDALALGVKPIGSILYFDNPPPYLAQTREDIEVIGKEEQPNIEKILTLKPDLIIGFKYSAEAIYNQLSQVAPTVLDDWEGYPSWRNHFNFVAEVLGKTEEAKQVWANYEQRIQSLKVALGNRIQALEISFVYICCGTIDIDLQNSFSGSILADVGLRRPAAQATPIEGGITLLSEERLMDIDGDILFVATDGKESAQKLAQLKQNPLWQNLKAVQHNRVYPVNYPTWRGGNPLAADAVIDDLFKYLVEGS